MIAGYLRISKDDERQGAKTLTDTERLNAAVERQRQDCLDLLADLGWGEPEWFIDRDKSAYQEAVVREEFERMLKGLEAGEYDGVVVYHVDRLARQPMDIERVLRIYRRRPGLRFATAMGPLDLGSENGEDMLRMQTMMAHNQSRASSRRISRKHRELAEAGKPVGSRRPFGMQDGGEVIEPTEAAEIRRAWERLLDGEALASIVRDWNDRGVVTSMGSSWSTQTLGRMLRSPRLSGWRVSNREIYAGRDGQPVRGTQEAIFTQAEHDQLLALFNGRGGRRPGQQPGKRKFLLSGLVRCATCGHRMAGNTTPKGGSYCCKPTEQGGGCGKNAISIPRLDQWMSYLFMKRIGDRRLVLSDQPWPHEADLAAVRAQHAEVIEAMASLALRPRDAHPVLDRLNDQEAVLARDRRGWHLERARQERSATVTPEAWEAMLIPARRAALATDLAAVVVRPAAYRGGRFDVNRVSITWLH